MNAPPLRPLRIASALEGATLVVLVCIAVPLKHLCGYPLATSIMGPIHGLAFLFYTWMAVNTVSSGGWRGGEIARLLLAAFIPFGALFVLPLIRRKEAALAGAAA